MARILSLLPMLRYDKLPNESSAFSADASLRPSYRRSLQRGWLGVCV